MMQALFTEIVKGDIQKVRARIEKDPSVLNMVASGSPKKYAGQSPLQVAIRSEQLEIAALLLQRGADPNFIEEYDANSPGGSWAAPVLHDAVMLAVRRSRWLRPVTFGRPVTEWKMVGSQAGADESFAIMEALLDAGADPNALDSYGNSVLGRAALDARQILPKRENAEGRPVNSELHRDLSRIFEALRSRGADVGRVEPNLGMSLPDYYAQEPVVAFITGEAA
ncbi:transient-receptor-potential channel family protein [Leucobacter tenebrionis]|uniref:hypothetical protein n=1 Tax=Leucobacter tenebrionis TaxID=2873270 RepID=UPI001CA75C83|nr:hypothetical protein [Leucobacter tenebrionis]QZY50880.1 hypothetical protein KVY00_09570 [Leucobacter tenebrionis]